jgi:protein-tyrosine phosphatase
VQARSFVDCHSHVVPSGDDGVGSVEEGEWLCREAARRGTRILYATPHVWPHLVLTAAREAEIRAAYAELKSRADLELRLGFELTPDPRLLDQDPGRYRLDGTDCVLVEVEFVGSAKLLVAVAEHIEAAGLVPVIAHPERGESVLENPALADEFAERGWLLQVNATSLLGRHGTEPEELGWRLLDEGLAAVVASDGHRRTRPPYLDEAHAQARARLGRRADRFFDGTALFRSRRPASRAASRGA